VLRALVRRLTGEYAGERGTGVVLASAGSRDPGARAESVDLAGRLEAAVGVPVRLGFLSGAGPTVADAAAGLRDGSCRRLVAATHLIAPGRFWDTLRARLRDNGIHHMTEPLGDDPGLAAAVAGTYLTVA